MTGFGPLFQLQVCGMLCPCLEKSENSNARQAVRAINSACRTVQWHPNVVEKKNGWGSLFGGTASGKSTGRTTPCLARFVLRDSGADRHQPELYCEPLPAHQQSGGTIEKGATKVNLKLRRVDKVSLDQEDQIVLTSKAGAHGQAPRELARFTLLQPQSMDHDDDDGNGAIDTMILPVASDVRNLILHHFMVICEWERQRHNTVKANDPEYYESDDDDDENGENQPNFLQKRAQKAAHFAKREMEMQQTRRDREKRKAELVAASGGLKYTAIAMANMKS